MNTSEYFILLFVAFILTTMWTISCKSCSRTSWLPYCWNSRLVQAPTVALFRPVMATKTHNPTSFSPFSRIGYGLSPKLNSAAAPSQKSKQGGVDEEQYTPYNEPYEPPREVPRKATARGRWGDVALERVLNDGVASSSNVRKWNDV